MAETVGCARPTGAVVGSKPPARPDDEINQIQEEKMSAAKVGEKAPDFKAPAYHLGEFTEVQLADHLGKWVLLCFYPGDFTFV